MKSFQIMRKITIDGAHRVPDHASKCFHLHGHTWTVEAYCKGELYDEGPQNGMVMDFSFIKLLLMENVDKPCDHGTILHYKDPWVKKILTCDKLPVLNDNTSEYWSSLDHPGSTFLDTKLYLISTPPTSECLAQHWYNRLKKAIIHSQGRDLLHSIKVWETPNCYAVYPCE